MTESPAAVANGWTVYFHDGFARQRNALIADVEAISRKSPVALATHPKAEFLKRLNQILCEEVPADPAHPQYRQGQTLGRYTGWQRVKFLRRYRLFFRFHSGSKIIIFAWMSNEDTLRKEGAKTDPYAVFRGMLTAGTPPADWTDLCRAVIGDK